MDAHERGRDCIGITSYQAHMHTEVCIWKFEVSDSGNHDDDLAFLNSITLLMNLVGSSLPICIRFPYKEIQYALFFMFVQLVHLGLPTRCKMEP